jgi:hypothetical protein
MVCATGLGLLSRPIGPIVSASKDDPDMNAKENSALIGPEGKRPAPWRSSLYDEPIWVSIVWIVVPALFAGIAIYFAVR